MMSKKVKNLEDYCKLVIHSTDRKKVLESLDCIVNEYGKENRKLNTVLINEGVIDQIVVTMEDKNANSILLHKSLMVLNNLIASSTSNEFTEVMSLSFVPRLVELVTSRPANVQEQAVWILDNIAQDFGPFTREILDAGVFKQVVKALSCQPGKNIVVLLARLLKNLTVDEALKSNQYAEEITQLVPALANILQTTFRLSDAIPHACCALSNLTENDENQSTSSEVFKCHGLVGKLIELARNPTTEETQLYALSTLCNLSGGPESKMKKLISLSLLPALSDLAQSTVSEIASTACHALSNFCAGSAEVIQSVVEADLVPLLTCLAVESSHPDVRTYASYALMFAFHGSNLPQTRYLVDCMCVSRVVALLKVRDVNSDNADLVCEALRCLDTLLYKFECVSDFDHVSGLIESASGWAHGARLRKCKHEKVCELAVQLDHDKLREAVVEYEGTFPKNNKKARKE